MATTSHIRQRGARRRGITFVILLVLLAAGGASSPASARDSGASGAYSYGWPIKPFDRQHPIRGYFGDPRSVFDGPPTERGLMTSRCACSLHDGIDIPAPTGTPVYPVRSGVVTAVRTQWVRVDTESGSAFLYGHIDPVIRVGERVSARETVLGRTRKALEHVHMTQLQDERPVNPLAKGNLGPYVDPTVPRVGTIAFRGSDKGPTLLPEYLHGKVEVVAEASDVPATPVPGMWAKLPVSPATLSFRIASWPSKAIVVDTTVARDVAQHFPEQDDFWRTYARGTRMNMVHMLRRAWYQPGVYLFKLMPDFDTRTLRDGVYQLTVTASDTGGNRASTTQIFSVHNNPRWLKP